MISESDVKHLECVEHNSFFPIGRLYQNVFNQLLERGLVDITINNSFIISDEGKIELNLFREHNPK